MQILIAFSYIISNSFDFFLVFNEYFFDKHDYNFDDANKIGYSRPS